MTLATLYSDVSEVLARGTSQDGKIPRWARHAAQWLEQNYSFKYMEKHGESYLDPEAVEPNVLTLPNTRVKSVLLVQQFQDNDGLKIYADPLPKAERANVTSIDSGWPSGWWQVGNALHFDAKPITPFWFDLVWLEYTSWPTDTSATPTLLQRYENLLFAQTLVNAWRELKDQESQATWTAERDMALRAVLVAEDEEVWQGLDLRMGMS